MKATYCNGISLLILLAIGGLVAQAAGFLFQSVEEIRAKAEKGDTDAQREMGWRYYMGDGVPRDYDEAAKWYDKAAKSNKTNASQIARVDAPRAATNTLTSKADTNAVSASTTTPMTLAEAQAQYEADARTNKFSPEKGLYTNAPWSEVRLRTTALSGDGLAASLCSGSNSTEELFWLSLAATNGWIPSQVRLARDFEYERPKDRSPDIFDSVEIFNTEIDAVLKQPKEVRRSLATYWWAKARAALPKLKEEALQKNPQAVYALGVLHKSGDLVQSNWTTAVGLFRKAATLGLPPAQEAWGSHCDWQLTNQIEAADWYYRAATQGLAVAQSSLSSLHREPSQWHFDPRFPRTASEGARWVFERAALPIPSYNKYLACLEMGDLFSRGTGVESNTVEAVRWYRLAIETGVPYGGGEYNLALCYFGGDGVTQDDAAGLKWLRMAKDKGYTIEGGPWEVYEADAAAENGDYHKAVRIWRKGAALGQSWAQAKLGTAYRDGKGLPTNAVAAVECFEKAAQQGDTGAQFNLGYAYSEGNGVPQDYVEAAKWYRKSANQGDASSQNNLGVMYLNGHGVPQDYAEAYKWYNLAAAQGMRLSARNRDDLAQYMTRSQIAEGQRLAREFKPSRALEASSSISRDSVIDSQPTTTGSGFIITEDGFLVTNAHVVDGASKLALVTTSGLIPAKIVKVDASVDLALLKTEGRFEPLPVAPSRSVRLGATVATVGFPNIGLQGFAPKLSKGDIAALSGIQDDAKYFQISVPVQPGNSGGALVDSRGNVVGVVSAKLSARVALVTSGALPENVNYAVKSSFLLGFLESVPEVSASLKDLNSKDRTFEDVVKSAENAAVLVLVY